MAKLIGGILSKGSGRLGGHVLAVSAGQQIIREYQPNVANPRSFLQRSQRAKVVLAGKLSQITPNEVLIGMGASKRDRRSEFTRHIIKNAVLQEIMGGKLTAVLFPENLQFSKGMYVGGVNVTIGVMSATNVAVTPSWEYNVDAVMVVAVVYNATLQRYTYVGWELSDKSGDQVDLSLPNVTGGSAANIYVIPLVRKVTGVSVTSGGVDNDKGKYTGNIMVGSPDAYEHRESIYIGTATMG